MDRLLNDELLARFERRVDGAPAGRPALLRRVLVAGAMAAVAVTWTLSSGASEPADHDLIRLLRGMAAIKGLLALGAAVAVAWRLGRPTSRLVASAYLVGVWLLFAAACLIWQAAFIPVAALLFHAAGLGLLLVSMRDGIGPSLRRW